MIQTFGINTLGTDYVVGDIHGCFSLLQSELDEMGFNPDIDRLFSVGDLVDRGPESERVLEWLDKPWFYAVKGNHEDMAVSGNLAAHLMNGGKWLMLMDEQEAANVRSRLVQLPVAMEVETSFGSVGIVHAEVPFDDWAVLRGELNDDHLNVALWARDIVRGRPFNGVKNIDQVVVGHTPMSKGPVRYSNVTYLDTGAVFGGPMTIRSLNSLFTDSAQVNGASV